RRPLRSLRPPAPSRLPRSGPVARGGRLRRLLGAQLRDAGRDTGLRAAGRRPRRHVDGAGGDRGAGGRDGGGGPVARRHHGRRASRTSEPRRGARAGPGRRGTGGGAPQGPAAGAAGRHRLTTARARSTATSTAKNGANATPYSGYGKAMAITAAMATWKSHADATHTLRHMPPSSATGAPSSTARAPKAAKGSTVGWAASQPPMGERRGH